MLRKVGGSDQVGTMTGRIVAFDRARTFITLLVVIHHSVVNFTHFGNGDRMRWLGFDLVVLFNDSFFMAFMFLISGLFVHDSLTRHGAGGYLRRRAWRLGIPLLVSIFVLIPIAYYASFLRYHMPGTTDFNYFHYWGRMITTGPWPSGQSWFLWVLLVFDVIAAAIWMTAPKILGALGRLIGALRSRPVVAFAAFVVVSVVSYLPMHVWFGDGAWFEPGHYPFPVQTSRILLYPAYFFTGVGIGVISLRVGILAENGEVAKRWATWLAFAVLLFGLLLLLVFAHHNWIENVAAPPLWWRTAYGTAFAVFSAAMAFTVPTISLRLSRASLWLLDAMQPSAYGIFLFHYMFIIWLQYFVYDPAWPAGIKAAIVFAVTLGGSWLLTVLLRRIPLVARTI
ncbi:acyltransferase family protein [Bradyrhizobium sp. McL0615]|uniref:acyltransferase family protein n=1 Tax=Bradyrhizobium sp. McL0615 TaxID=3415673 RepID=UPI003CF183C4